VSRLAFFVLLVIAAAFGTQLWLAAQRDGPDPADREVNRDDVKLLSATAPPVAAMKAEEARREMQGLAGAACVEFAGFATDDLARVRAAFAALNLGDRLLEHRDEEVSRYWVFMPAERDRRAAETTAAQLRRQGVTDQSIRPDNAISLGVFSSEEAGRRFLAALEGKGVHGAQLGPFAKELREVALLVREPDTEMVARLTILQRDFAGARLRAVSCPAVGSDASPGAAPSSAAPTAAPAGATGTR